MRKRIATALVSIGLLVAPASSVVAATHRRHSRTAQRAQAARHRRHMKTAKRVGVGAAGGAAVGALAGGGKGAAIGAGAGAGAGALYDRHEKEKGK